MPEPSQLQSILAEWRRWPLSITAPPTLLGPVLGGRTNRNFKIQAPGTNTPLILRINNPHAAQLGINRTHEAQIVKLVADAGITPEPIYRDPSMRYLLLPFIEARTWSSEDFCREQQRARLLTLLNHVFEIKPATDRRSYLAYLDNYWSQLQQVNAIDNELSDQWYNFRAQLSEFDKKNWPVQLTHHDLIPENILDTGSRIYLIDWEYAALGHKDIDLWCIDPTQVKEPFIHELANWTNLLWEKLVTRLRLVNG